MMGIKGERSVNLDIIRSIALLMVYAIHSLIHMEFYEQNIVWDIRLWLFACVRALANVCVPLFIMLSGYLLKDRKAGKTYYIKLFRIIILYILCSIICLLFKQYLQNVPIGIFGGGY